MRTSDSGNGRASERLPDFIAVGPPRTGTTWLHRALTGSVILPLVKETHYFSYNYHLGLDWYRACFNASRWDRPVGEITPTYFDHPQARERIAEVIPDCKIIISLRDPVERTYSQYKVWFRAGLVEGPFDYTKLRTQLAANASYVTNLKAWRALFGPDNLLMVFYDDLRSDPQYYLDSICAFIGCSRIDLNGSSKASPVNLSDEAPRSLRAARLVRQLRDELIRRHRWRLARLLEPNTLLWNLAFTGGERYSSLDQDTERQLRKLLRPEVEELESFLGRDLSAWKKDVADAKAEVHAART